MLDIKLRIKGLGALIDRLRRVPGKLDQGVSDALTEFLAILRGDLAEYPPQVPGTRYRRTGLLGQRWSSATTRVRHVGLHRLEARMTNTRPGAAYVQLGTMQAAAHRGRWKTAEQIIEENRGELDRMLEQAGERAIR